MNNQNRYYILLVAIFAIGASAYLIIFPNFETTQFDQEVIENISKGVTTTVAEVENEVEINKENNDFALNLLDDFRALKHRSLAFPDVLEGLGSSGRLVGIVSTYPGTSPRLW